MSDQATVDPLIESLKRAAARFPNWPQISSWIGGDSNNLVMTMLGIWAPDLAPEATRDELQTWFGFDGSLMAALTSEQATEKDHQEAAALLVRMAEAE